MTPQSRINISELISKENVIPELNSDDPDGIIKEMAAFLAARRPGLDAKKLADALTEREQNGSTAVGRGIAIPHAKLGLPGGLAACLGRSRGGVEFGSADGEPTRLFFVLAAPEGSAGAHLKALAKISRLAMTPGFLDRMLKAKTAEEMHGLLAEPAAR
ncbi:MAG: PTS sugar transporter subunit IIA [Elusimicrobiales bacterium]|nr:PTS sugar transporter subunit IIA [Elusimicrobiales bacterium]